MVIRFLHLVPMLILYSQLYKRLFYCTGLIFIYKNAKDL